MNQKDKKNIGINWAFVLFAAILGFFVNILSDSVFDIYANGFRRSTIYLFVVSLLVSVFFVGFLSYVFETANKSNEKDGVVKLMFKYVKSWFNK